MLNDEGYSSTRKLRRLVSGPSNWNALLAALFVHYHSLGRNVYNTKDSGSQGSEPCFCAIDSFQMTYNVYHDIITCITFERFITKSSYRTQLNPPFVVHKLDNIYIMEKLGDINHTTIRECILKFYTQMEQVGQLKSLLLDQP